jgi:hypothetical protein
MKKPYYFVALLALPLAISNAFAADSGSPIAISGYGTVGYAVTDTDKAEFARPNQRAGTSNSPRNTLDSNLGLQATYTHNEWLSVTAQGLVRQNGTDSWGGELYWGFAKAKISDNLSVRVGRMGLPVFMISDYRNVGYANTMIRPPAEVYSQVPIDSIDGVDVIYQRSFGDTTVTSQLAVGSTEATLSAAGTTPGGRAHAKASSMSAINIVAEHGPVTVRFGHARAKLSIDDSASLNTLLGGLRGVGAGYGFTSVTALADSLAMRKKDGTFTSVGATYDQNNIVLQGEYAKRKTDGYVSDTTSWYTMAAYKLGKFTPYVSHASLRRDSVPANTVPASCPAGYPAACTPTLNALSAGVTALTIGSQGEQSTNTVGTRWDFSKAAALKVQLDDVKPRNGQGMLLNPVAGFKDSVKVLSVAVDYVF